MHIKQVTLHGFKTFKNQTIVGPFSQYHNTTVGRNGAGKSNIFRAIAFVLSDKYTSLSSQERAKLIHTGSGQKVVSAYVEITFDNSDHRVPLDRDEFVLRRAIGIKKDEYFLDRKHVTKNEVVNLLESAGFSRSNPYYMVEQGRVKALEQMRDEQRLELLKEVAGTRVYDDRRAESMTIMENTDKRRDQIAELLTYIEARLKELESEKEELKQYQNLDKDRRSLEYTLYDKELTDARTKLDKLDQQRAAETERVSEYHSRTAQMVERIQVAEHEAKALAADLEALQRDRENASDDRQELIKSKAKLELEVADLTEKNSLGQTDGKTLQVELKQIEKDIKKTQKELDTVTPQFEAALAQENETKENLTTCKRRIQEMYSKGNRGREFKTQAERDAFLRKEIKQGEKTLTEKEKQLSELRQEQATLQQVLNAEANELDAGSSLEDNKAKLEQLDAQHAELKAEHDKQVAARKEAWRTDSQLTSQLRVKREAYQEVERAYQSSVSRGTLQGIAAVKRIAREKKIKGVYGPMIELFSTEETWYTATEVSVGKGLFNVVVDTDSTAAKLLSELKNSKDDSGRVTFVPLNRVKAKKVAYPETSDAVPLVSKLVFEDKYKPAFEHLFGKILVCRDLTTATQYSKSHELDCITLKGEQVNRRGALTGGYHDTSRSHLRAFASLAKLKAGMDELSAKADAAKKAGEAADREVTRLHGEKSKVESERRQTRARQEQRAVDSREAAAQHESRTAALQHTSVTIETVASSIRELEASLESQRSELGTPMVSELTRQDKEQLRKLQADADKLENAIVKCSNNRTAIESKRNFIANQLNTNLIKRRDELTLQLTSAGLNKDDIANNLREQKRDLEQVLVSINDATALLQGQEVEIEAKTARQNELETVLEEMRSQVTDARQSLQGESSRQLEKLLSTRSVLIQKREDAMKKIRDLGSLPADAFDRFVRLPKRELMKKLYAVNEDLKQYSHVNKKALDQYMSFTEQRDSLLTRKTELDQAAGSIRDMIAALDQRKDEAIERTFKGVAKNFSEVFTELVPSGKAALVMQRREQHGDDEGGRVDSYSGISMKVSFSGRGHDPLASLSGGQTSLLALTLIFAIQRCDPAPFYLFDEIDAALDPVHRRAVASMIKRQAHQDKDANGEESGKSSVQFLTVSFKPEFLHHADAFYGVQFRNDVSTIGEITQDEALAILADADVTHDETSGPSKEDADPNRSRRLAAAAH